MMQQLILFLSVLWTTVRVSRVWKYRSRVCVTPLPAPRELRRGDKLDEMQGVVFVFLLDHLSGKAFNNSLDALATSNLNISNVQRCSADASELIVNILAEREAREAVNVRSAARYRQDTAVSGDAENEGYLLDFDNSRPEIEQNERSINKVNNFDTNNFKTDIHVNISDTDSYPERAPFLVAIFETLSNITAHTCAGTLLAPEWVLTSFSCINVLKYLIDNTTEVSRYTVVANANNPLVDGSVHNVTEVRTWHDTNVLKQKKNITWFLRNVVRKLKNVTKSYFKRRGRRNGFKHLRDVIKGWMGKGKPVHRRDLYSVETDREEYPHVLENLQGTESEGAEESKYSEHKVPNVVLMRIAPPAHLSAEPLDVMEEAATEGEDVSVYRWVLERNDTSDRMYVHRGRGRLGGARACQPLYVEPLDDSLLCVALRGAPSQDSDTAEPLTIMISLGGPVLSVRARRPRLLAVTQTEDSSPLVAHSLRSRAHWIRSVMHGSQ